jgi:hypothetical protein
LSAKEGIVLESSDLDSPDKGEELDSIAAPAADKPSQVLDDVMKIHELRIERPAIIAYLQAIAPEKHEIALMHALEVGIMELQARRERFRH